MKNMTPSITDAAFDDEVLKSGGPVLVDFWADWCGPCRVLQPTLEEIAVAYSGKVKILKLNVSENRKTMERFGCVSIPLLILFCDGTEAARSVGLVSKTRLCEFIDANI